MVCFLSKHQKSGIFYLWFSTESGKRNKVSTRTTDIVKAEMFKENFLTNKNTKTDEPEPMKLIEYSNIFLKRIRDDFSSGTILLYESTFKLLFHITGNKYLKDITREDIEKLKAERLKTAKKISVNINLRNLKTFFNAAIKDKNIKENIVTNDIFYKLDETPIKYFTESQINQLLNSIKDNRKKSLFQFAVKTGMRLSEIINLQYSDIDAENNIINISQKDNFRIKTGENRRLPITKNILDLTEYEKYKDYPNKYVFAKQRKEIPYNKSYISRKFKIYLRKAKLPENLHFHCLRHTFITDKVKQRTPLKAVMRLAGHKAIETTLNYTHLNIEDLRCYM